MRTDQLTGLVAVFLFVGGCQTTAGDYDSAARIVNPTQASRAALQQAINQEVGTSVVLADDALTDRSILVIERTPRPTMEDPVPMGRVMEPPIQFRLVTNGTDCILIDERDRSRTVLEQTNCIAE
jgi:hypothetical protein